MRYYVSATGIALHVMRFLILVASVNSVGYVLSTLEKPGVVFMNLYGFFIAFGLEYLRLRDQL